MSTHATRDWFRRSGRRTRPATHRYRSRRGLGTALAALMVVTALPAQALALPPGDARNGPALTALQQEAEAALDEAKAAEYAEWTGDQAPSVEYQPSAVTVPEGGTAAVPLDAAGDDLVQAGDLPVSLGKASPTEDNPAPPEPSGTWNVEVEARAAVEGLGVDGALITVTPPSTTATPVDVALDYSAFEDLYGTEWATRLKLEQLPECFLTTPELPECTTPAEVPSANDAGSDTVRATVDPARAQASGMSTQAGGGPMVLAATDGGAGAGGTYKATDLSPTGSWTAGGSGGGFSWTYPLTVPAPPAGPAPEIAFSYSSQAVDGKTSVANGQASWIGDGWDWKPGFIERRYRSCSEDLDGSPNNDNTTDKKKSDLCWSGNHVVMSLGGASTELVLDDGQWVPATDDGTKVELRKDTALGNGDNDGEHWVVTSRDGTRHWFGKHRVGGGRADTNSVFTAPVFGNHAGEPCHASTFAGSSCTQAWRWNLDYVEDVHGNAMVVDWAKETNRYAKNGKFKDHVSYVRGGWPKRVDYGLRAGDLDGAPAGRVVFSVAERCIKEGEITCSDASFDSDNYGDKQPWWDTPSTLYCQADAENCYVSAPTFWTRKRLSGVTTYAQRTEGSTALSKVDVWSLEHSFPKQRTDTHPPLWLESITRTGYGPRGTATTLPPVTFLANVVDMPNRVARSTADPTPDFDRLRVETIRTETGGEIQVTYSNPCPLGASPDPDTNGTRCFPVHWSPDPELEEPEIEWFNKYVVTKVVERDRVARQPDVLTTYTYEGDAAWAKDRDPFSKPELRTYSQWRGYASVVTRQGRTENTGDHDATVQTQTRTRYFRGMSGDAGRAAVTVKDSTGQTLAEDLYPYQGRTAETLLYDGAGGDVLARDVSWPWAEKTASRTLGDGLPALEAWRSGVRRTDAVQSVTDGERTVRTVTTVDDTYGLPTTVQRETLTPDGSGGHTTGDRQCVTHSYVHNPAKHLIGLPSRQRTTVGTCAQAATATGDAVVSDTRTSYDALDAFGVAPARGLPRQVDTVDGDGSGWITTARSTFDALGRVTSATDAKGAKVTTTYAPTAGPAFSSTTTNPLGHTTVTAVDPGRGTAHKVTDPNGRTVTSSYDDLGRITAVWTASQNPATDDPAHAFAYQIAEDAPPTVTTSTLRDNGTYADTVTLYDGLLRTRQTQTEALGGGRVITDTRYNSQGKPAATNDGYLTRGEPERSLFFPETVFQVPQSTETAYDGLARPVRTTTLYEGEADHSSVTAYAGEWTLTRTGMTGDGTSTRRGSAAARTWTDVLGRTTRIQHFTTPNLSEWTDTRYTYDARGHRTKVTDPDGNEWTYAYDARGRLTESTDPDMGTASFTYDARDQQVTATDAQGRTRHTSYDVLGRKTALREDSADGTLVAAWTYDTLPGAKGLPVAATRYTDGAAFTTETTGYDTEYRPTGSRTVIPDTPQTTGLAGTYTYRQTYTPTGLPETTVLPATPGGLSQEKVITRYNGEDAPVSTSGHDWYTAETTYSPYGEVLRTVSGEAPHRVWSTAEYDPYTRRLDRTITDREKAAPHRVTNTYYGYDIAGNVTWITDDGPGTADDRQCFSYDTLGQLRHAWTASTGGCPRQSTARDSGPVPSDVTAGPDGDGYWHTYAYDAIGNRTQLTDHDLTDPALDDTYTYSYGTTVTGNGTSAPVDVQPHTLTRVDAVEKTATGTVESLQTYAYDLAGNTTERMIGGDTQKLTWNAENKLTSVDTTGDGVEDITYLYDADGNRVVERTPTDATLFLGDAQITVNAAGNATEARRYYSHAGAPTTVRSTGGSADRDDHTLTVLLADHHNTANTAVTLDAAMAVQRRKFDPFGNPRGDEPAAWPGRDSFLGTGIDDPLTGLTHIGAREYDATTGRFISVDPLIDITDPQQMNGYAYANNNPVTLSDPSGLAVPECLQGLIQCSGGVPTSSSGGSGVGSALGGATSAGGMGAVSGGRASSGGASYAAIGTPVTRGTGRARINLQATVRVSTSCPWAMGTNTCNSSGNPAYEKQYVGGSFYNTDVSNKPCSGFAICIAVYALAAVASAVIFAPPCIAAAPACARIGEEIVAEAVGEAVPGIDMPRRGQSDRKAPSVDCKNSFPEGVGVLMSDGSVKRIEDVEPGDEVIATDPETGHTESKKVTASIFTSEDKSFVDLAVLVDGEKEVITATTHHPFWSESERSWKDAGDVEPGMSLRTEAGHPVEVVSARQYDANYETYNLTVLYTHTYYVLAGETPVLVHNANCPWTSVRKYDGDGHPVDGTRIPTNDALDSAEKWLGSGYKETVPGSGRYVSRDGTRVARMGESDITGQHGGGPHMNFERLAPNPKKPGKMMVVENRHIYLE
ncbi:polymorphic toxin-type HINT domain-containing protein [Streptomyces sp. TRM 70351]|uniref:polymorphic toxin-type HINT domain-containing protein n=1 Tax=Streptomyces sp. TRM 70351 TaxID=3116552 RepID=UPI002E7B99F5|nr:polymorphic toxin-type HINT domain-containing protein [Streptomyces sp. TRM 70351]MEE1928019.1 polymorphic toxin-type HINT domain-containing protein [Streptomyces sp. TRM 70351]